MANTADNDLFTKHLFHVADLLFHFPLDFLCCATVLQIRIANSFSSLFLNFARDLSRRSLYFVCCA